MTAPLVCLAGAVALSILSMAASRERAGLRSLGGDPCTNATAAADSSPITFRADVLPRIAAGQPIPIRLTLANYSERMVPIAYSHSQAGLAEIPFDIRITRVSDGARVWGRLGELVVWTDEGGTEAPLAAGDSFVYADRWTQKMSNGQFVTPGTYCIRGVIDAKPEDGRRHKRWFTSEAALVTIVRSVDK